MSKSKARQELFRRGILKWKLHKAQLLIYDLVRGLSPDTREALIFCARRFGKSFLGIVLALEDAIRNPNVQVAIIGPTLKQTKAIVTPLLKIILSDCPKGLVTQSKSTSTWNISNGSSLMLGGFDTIAESFRGLDIYSMYLEETGFAKTDLEEYQYLLYSILFPTLMHSRGRIHHLTTPSRVIDHPLHTETLPKCMLNKSFYRFTVDQNPLLTPETIEKEIENAGGRDSVNARRELYAEILRDDAIMIVPQFDESLHVGEIELAYDPYLKYLIAGDMGYTNDLTTFHLMAWCHTLGKIKVVDEKVFQPKTATKEIVEALQDWDDYQATIVADIQGNTRVDMATLGLAAAAPIKDKFGSTITFVRNEFFQDKFLIDPRCSLLIQTLRSGTFNKAKTDFARNSTTGHCDAIMSACVYGARSVDRITDLRPKPKPSEIFTLPPPTDPRLKAFGSF